MCDKPDAERENDDTGPAISHTEFGDGSYSLSVDTDRLLRGMPEAPSAEAIGTVAASIIISYAPDMEGVAALLDATRRMTIRVVARLIADGQFERPERLAGMTTAAALRELGVDPDDFKMDAILVGPGCNSRLN